MTPNRRIFLNIIATYGRSVYALVCGAFAVGVGGAGEGGFCVVQCINGYYSVIILKMTNQYS